ncbi:MAG: phosphomethylpyrimidine synthase ThiC, partial [Candidatus Hydrogenedentes bacterium]|nr:phosphomethylpyrimidine synthase ThiC [Candidatus Hydrogenedentota bacterium]
MSVSSERPPVFAEGQADVITRKPFPNSRKVYVQGKIKGLRVPMREVAQTPTKVRTAGNGPSIPNPAITLYDTSGPYTDPDAGIDVRKGLAPLRAEWIMARGDVDALDDITSEYGRRREHDPGLASLRFVRSRRPLRAKAGRRVTQMHYAKRGEITPEMEFVAIRENMRLEQQIEELRAQHPGHNWGAS